MAMNRVFTGEELEEVGRRTVDLLTEAIEAGDVERAKKLAKRMYREFALMHDLYRDWTAGFKDYMYRNYGKDALYQVLRKAAGSTGRPSANVEKLDFRRQVRGLARVLPGDLEAMKVEEDDEKVWMQMQPCGSGQRLLEDGGYGPARNLAMIQKPHPMTWGLADFRIYCTHCPVLAILSIERLGFPAIVATPGEKVASGSCKCCIYKDPKDIPGEVYIMLGQQKPR
jgi:hypothetical protein